MTNVDLIVGLQTTLANDLVSKTLAPHGQRYKQSRTDRHEVTPTECPTTSTMRCGYCVNPSEKTVMRRQQAKETAASKQQRAEDTAALISQINAFERIYGPSADIELRRKRALVEEEELCSQPQGESVVPLNSLVGTVATNEVFHNPLQRSPMRDCVLCSLTVDKNVLLTPETTAEEISEPSSLDLTDVTLNGKDDEGSVLPGPEQIFGSETLQAGIRSLCTKYQSIFSSKVRDTPALVAPLEIEIEEGSVWRIPASRRGPRPQSPEKMIILKEMIESLLRLIVIRDSKQQGHTSKELCATPSSRG